MSHMVTAVLNKVPNTTQNPLYPLDKFSDFCCKRFREPLTFTLPKQLQESAEAGVLKPLIEYQGAYFYSNFQLWQVEMLHSSIAWGVDPTGRIAKFEPLLRLLAEIQDWYLPEVRGNRRFGDTNDYGGRLAFGGAMFCQTTNCVVSYIRTRRNSAIQDRSFIPLDALQRSGLTAEELDKWKVDIQAHGGAMDPLEAWRDLVTAISYEQRQLLKEEALMAQDYYEIVNILHLFSVDAGLAPSAPEYADPLDLSPRDEATGMAAWKVARYGETIWNPHAQLEFIVNAYDINPRPRAIVITEGEEYQAIADLYRECHCDPELLGIEFRSLGGAGNFTLANWQVFIEYMHEKQVLIFFMVDREGEAAKQARRLLDSKRRFDCPGLHKVIPSKDRIAVWNASFEADNFTDAEIATELSGLGIATSAAEIEVARQQSQKGLIEAVFSAKGTSIAKAELCKRLVASLITARRENTKLPLRPIESFVQSSGKLIAYNYQPTHIETVKKNRSSGLLG